MERCGKTGTRSKLSTMMLIKSSYRHNVFRQYIKMSTRQFLNFSTLKEDVVHTVKTVQRLYDDSAEYYMYLITVVAPDDPLQYYMTIYDVKTTFTAIHDKLEADRSKGLAKEFTFTKTMIESEPNTRYPYIVVTGENEVVELE